MGPRLTQLYTSWTQPDERGRLKPDGSLPQPTLESKLAVILGICEKMNAERELGPLLDIIAREAASLLGCERVSITLNTGREQHRGGW